MGNIAHPHFEVEMRSGSAATPADSADLGAALHPLSLAYQVPPMVRIHGAVHFIVPYDDYLAVSPHMTAKNDASTRCRLHGRPEWGCDVDTVMTMATARAKARGQSALSQRPIELERIVRRRSMGQGDALADANQVGIANAIEAGQILVREAIAAGDLRERFPGAYPMRGGEMVGACRHTHHTE